jgi:hypothetical protein
VKPELDEGRLGDGSFRRMAGAAAPASGSFGMKLMAMNTSNHEKRIGETFKKSACYFCQVYVRTGEGSQSLRV